MILLLDAMLCTLQKVDSCKEKSQAEEAKRHENQARYCKEYRVKIEHELLGTCREVLNLLNGRQGGATLLLCNMMCAHHSRSGFSVCPAAHLLPVANPDVAEHMSNVILSADKFKGTSYALCRWCDVFV